MLQSNLSYLTEDRLGWSPDGTSMIFFVAGLVGIFTQGVLVRRLLPLLGEARMAIAGFASQASGLFLISIVTVNGSVPMLFIAIVFVAMGNGLITPSVNSMASAAVGVKEQGRVQGGNQSVQSLGRVLGPLWGGWSYGALGQAAPYLSGAAGLLLGALTVIAATPMLLIRKTKPS
jgi:MFS transporter, DHA1 family, tetracycline resistance protein